MAATWSDPRLGYKVHNRAATPQLDIARFRELSTANVSDVLGKILTFDYRIKPVVPIKAAVVGFAVTVQVHPGDNLMIFKAMELAHPGDVIVISDQFDTNNALIGGVMAEMAAAKGVAAFVTDGLVRDAEELEASGLALFARGLTPLAPVRGGPLGQVNTTICCGGVIVQPGDIIMGDSSGVVVIPAADAELVLERGQELLKKEWNWLHPEKDGDYALYKSSHEAMLGQGCEIDPV
jgi:regulator of RNase E activity RraA